MKTYSGELPYVALENDVHQFFSKWIGKEPSEVKNIVIVGGCTGVEVPTYLTRYPNSKIYIVEPNPLFYGQLYKSFIMTKRVIPFCCACSDKDGVVEFFETDVEGNGSLFQIRDSQYNLAKVKNTHSYKVITKCIQDLLPPEEEIDLMQVDVQGAELLVLQGADLLKISSMYLEAQSKKTWDKKTDKSIYHGQCFLEDLEEFLKGQFMLHSVAFDYNNDTGNSFWVKESLKDVESKLDYVDEWILNSK